MCKQSTPHAYTHTHDVTHIGYTFWVLLLILCTLILYIQYMYAQSTHHAYTHVTSHIFCTQNECCYGVATISRLLKMIGLFCRIWSLLYGSFEKETYIFKDATNRSHPILIMCTLIMCTQYMYEQSTHHAHTHTHTAAPYMWCCIRAAVHLRTQMLTLTWLKAMAGVYVTCMYIYVYLWTYGIRVYT